MNMVLSLTKTRYLMYVEDDWWVIHDTDNPPTRSGPGNILWRAMEVLKRSSERVSQASEFSQWCFTLITTVAIQYCRGVSLEVIASYVIPLLVVTHFGGQISSKTKYHSISTNP